MKLGQQAVLLSSQQLPGWLSASRMMFQGVLQCQCQCFPKVLALPPPSSELLRWMLRNGLLGIDVCRVDEWRLVINFEKHGPHRSYLKSPFFSQSGVDFFSTFLLDKDKLFSNQGNQAKLTMRNTQHTPELSICSGLEQPCHTVLRWHQSVAI